MNGTKSAMVFLGMWMVACGELADDQYQGEPAARLTGNITGDLGGSDPGNPFVAILWVNKGDDDETTRIVTDVASLTVSEFPARFELGIFDEPAPDRLFDLENDEDIVVGEMAMGWLVALDDANDDGSFARVDWALEDGDQYLGVAWLHKLIWVSTSEAASYLTNGEQLTPGFYLHETACGAAHEEQLNIVDSDTPIEITLFDPVSSLVEEELDDDFCP